MSAEQSVLLEGLEEQAPASSPTPAFALRSAKPQLRWQPLDRQHIVLEVVDTDRLVEQDHDVRASWDLLQRLDLSRYDEGIKAVQFNPEQNCYICPEGKRLTYKGSKPQVGAIEKHYRA